MHKKIREPFKHQEQIYQALSINMHRKCRMQQLFFNSNQFINKNLIIMELLEQFHDLFLGNSFQTVIHKGVGKF